MAAGFNSDSTYDLPKQMALRVATIILEDASEILRRRLKDLIYYEFRNLDNFLSRKNKKATIHTFTKPQIDKIYPKNGRLKDLSGFDVTLCINVIRVINKLKGKFLYENEIDNLCKNRNEHFAHLSAMVFDINDYITLENCQRMNKPLSVLASLEKSIYDLCKDKNEKVEFETRIKNHLEANIEPEKLESLRDKMTNLVLNDREDVLQIVGMIQQKTGDALKKQILDFETVCNQNILQASSKLNRLIKSANKIDETIIKNISSIHVELKNMREIMENSDETLKGMQSSFSELKENLNTVPQDLQFMRNTIDTVGKSTENTERSALYTENTISRVDCHLNTLPRNLESTPSNLQVIQSSISSLEKDFSNVESAINATKSFISLSLADFKTFFTDKQNIYFKILILSANNVNNSLNKVEVTKALAGIDWNVIIDLDPDSRVRDKGFHDLLKDEIKKIHLKTYLPIIYDSLQDINNDDVCSIYHGEWLLYILAKGCRDVGVEEPENFRVSTLMIMDFLGKLYKHIQQKTLLCINFMMNQTYDMSCNDNLENIIDLNNDFFNSADFLKAKPKLVTFFVLDSSCKINYADLDRNISSKLKEKYLCKAEISQILQAIKDCHLKRAINEILLPGKENNISIDINFYAQYSAFIELYHLDIGKIDKISSELLENQKESYLKGYEITPLQLYLDINHKIYVERDIVLEVHQKINDLLKQKHFFKKGSSRFIEVSAKLASGTTTLVRSLLFRFKNKVPCIRIKSIDQIDKIVEACLFIKRKCDLPLLLLIDSSDFPAERITLEKIKLISKQLDISGSIRNIIMFTSRKPYLFNENKHKTISNEVITYKLQSELSKNETILFKTLYKEYLIKHQVDIESCIQNFDCKSLVFWFGLVGFGKEFKSLTQLVSHLVENIKDDFKMIALLYLICFYNNFTCHGFPLNIAAMRLNKRPYELNIILKSKEGDGYEALFNLFILKEVANSSKIHCINSAIADEIMNVIVKSNDIQTKFEFFYEKFEEITSKATASMYPDDLLEVTTFLFILNEDSHNFTFLIEQTGKCKSSKWMCEQLKKIYDRVRVLEPLAHSFGMVYARYLFHVMEDEETGIQVLRESLKIKGKIDEIYNAPKFVVSQNLTQYGEFLRLTLKNSIEKNSTNANQLDLFISIAEEAIIAYKVAQNLRSGDPLKPYSEPSSRNISYNALAYIGECHTRNLLLDYYFKVVCKEDKEFYTELLSDESTDEIISNSENEIYNTLEKLDLLEKKGKLVVKGFDVYQMQIELLERRVNLEQETFDNVLKNIKCRYPVYDTIKAIYTRKFGYRNVDWGLFQENMFEHIITTCMDRIKNGSQSFKDYEDLINAFIYSQRYSKFTTATYLEQATVTAKEWKDRFSDEPEPYFYYGVLRLVSGIQNQDLDFLKSANENLKTCKSLYESFPLKTAKYTYREFQIGKKRNLQGLLPGNLEIDDKEAENTLIRFEGRFKYRTKHVKLFNIIPVYASQYGDNTMSEVEQKQENVYSFYLMIGRDGIYMFKRKRVQPTK